MLVYREAQWVFDEGLLEVEDGCLVEIDVIKKMLGDMGFVNYYQFLNGILVRHQPFRAEPAFLRA